MLSKEATQFRKAVPPLKTGTIRDTAGLIIQWDSKLSIILVKLISDRIQAVVLFCPESGMLPFFNDDIRVVNEADQFGFE